MPAPSSTSRAAHTSCTDSASGVPTETPRLGSRVASPSATSMVSASRTVGRETPREAASATSRSGVPDSSSPSKIARRSSSATRSTVEACSRWRVPNGAASCRASLMESILACRLAGVSSVRHTSVLSDCLTILLHTEEGKMPLSWGRHYVMVEPTHFRIDYVINPFMDTSEQPDRELALAQWHTLVETIEGLGGTVD